jgi:hypothetical protein
MKDGWECLGNIKHVLEPFKEGQRIYEDHKYVALLLFPIFINTIHQQLVALDDEMQREIGLAPFPKGSSKEGLMNLVSRTIVDFKQRWGTG